MQAMLVASSQGRHSNTHRKLTDTMNRYQNRFQNSAIISQILVVIFLFVFIQLTII